ncbi:MAG: GFA family protein [Granulosicoccus sp.]|nr:GFA family protein [Granulosicoccus sp.]
MLRGSCLCGGVCFELSGELRSVVNCHCQQCRRTHGHFAAYTNVSRDGLRIVSDETLSWYRSSDIAQRGFCRHCGSSLFWSRDGSGNISVAAGSIESPSGLSTSANIFVDSRGDYYEITDTLPQHSEGL